MLLTLQVDNLAIAERVELDFQTGMSVISGETGAGKSILIDALDLVLGGRADSSIVRHGASKTSVTASFDLSQNPAARAWLDQQEFDSSEELILRRVVSAEGRSRAFINGQAVPLTLLRNLSTTLIEIHGQHEHQNLLKTERQLELLDAFGEHRLELQNVALAFRQLQEVRRQLSQLQAEHEEKVAQKQLLSYQVQELNDAQLSENELSLLESEEHQLANADDIKHKLVQAQTLFDDGEGAGVIALLRQLQHLLNDCDDISELQEVRDMLASADIQLRESEQTIRHYEQNFEADGERLQQIQSRLSELYQLARKHQIRPESLYTHWLQLSEELASIDADESRLELLHTQSQQLAVQYQEAAQLLRQKRIESAEKMSEQLQQQLGSLNMKDAQISIQVNVTDQASSKGSDQVEFLFSGNKGQPLQPLYKVASGGELSRLSLAVEVLCQNAQGVPTLVFDEVDVGISGATAEVVGQLLRSLGQQVQLLVITHLPQVAAFGHQHYQVEKQTDGEQTRSRIVALKQEERIHELARLLGGTRISDNTLAHAREMIDSASNPPH